MNPNAYHTALAATASLDVASGSLHAPRMAAARAKWFYFGLACLFALISFTAFIPSYFLKIGNHTFTSPPIYHVHATLFFGWTLLNLSQAWLVATGRTYDHRRWGLLGIALATAMAISIVLMVMTSIKLADAHGAGLPMKRFSYLNISGVVKFSLFFAAAIFFIHRAEIHKRLIVIANSTLIGAPIGRLVVLLLVPPALRAGPPPVYAVLVILVLSYSPILAGVLFDWRTRGRPHATYVIGFILTFGTGLLVPLVSRTDAWLTTINHLMGLLG